MHVMSAFHFAYCALFPQEKQMEQHQSKIMPSSVKKSKNQGLHGVAFVANLYFLFMALSILLLQKRSIYTLLPT